MAASPQNATTTKIVETQVEVLCSRGKKTAAKKSVETQTEAPTRDASTQVTGCHECQSLAFAVLGDDSGMYKI